MPSGSILRALYRDNLQPPTATILGREKAPQSPEGLTLVRGYETLLDGCVDQVDQTGLGKVTRFLKNCIGQI